MSKLSDRCSAPHVGATPSQQAKIDFVRRELETSWSEIEGTVENSHHLEEARCHLGLALAAATRAILDVPRPAQVNELTRVAFPMTQRPPGLGGKRG